MTNLNFLICAHESLLKVPDGTVHVLYALSFFIEGLLFYWHMQLQAPLEVQVCLGMLHRSCTVRVLVQLGTQGPRDPEILDGTQGSG